MADIKITDNFSLETGLTIRDDSPLAKAKITQLLSTSKDLFADFDKPMDQADEKSFALGSSFTSPDLLSSDLPGLTIGVGINSQISIFKSSDSFLFGKDKFSPIIPIGSNQAWLGVEFDLSTKDSVTASAGALGVCLEGDAKFSCTTYTLSSVAKLPLPLLRLACAEALGNYSITTSPDAVRAQLAGTVNQTEVGGSIKAKVTLKQPFALNALASVNLPFNATASITPTVTLQVAGSVEIAGDLIVRSYKKSADVVQIGVYKKCGSTLTVTFTVGAGVAGEIGDDDLLGALLNAALPGVDATAAGITGDRGKDLNKVLKDAINRSLTASFNASCAAAYTDEAAVVYEIQLNQGAADETDEALKLALDGNWTSLASLSNAHLIRDITVETLEKKTSITLNLFGVYSATTFQDYVKSCTVQLDESGQTSIIDSLEESRISASAEPYASDSLKLRMALMEDFVCTATYAVVSDKLNLQLSVIQSYLDYKINMSSDEMNENVRLGYALGLIPNGSLDGRLKGTPSFAHAVVSAIVRYDTPALMSIFFSDSANRIARSQDELERMGRETMCTLLDSTDPTDAARIEILNNDSAWADMDEIGNITSFNTIDSLSHLGQTQLSAVEADWISIRWWANAVSKVAPALNDTLTSLQSAPAGNPVQDPNFMKQRARLANVLGAVTRKTDAAFVHGWGEAVMFALSGKHGAAMMDVCWNGSQQHFGPAPG